MSVGAFLPAVSDLASEDRDFRFAALLAPRDRNAVGRGAAGFALAEFGWGATERERARAKDFVLRATALAASGHRWSEPRDALARRGHTTSAARLKRAWLTMPRSYAPLVIRGPSAAPYRDSRHRRRHVARTSRNSRTERSRWCRAGIS